MFFNFAFYFKVIKDDITAFTFIYQNFAFPILEIGNQGATPMF